MLEERSAGPELSVSEQNLTDRGLTDPTGEGS